MGSDMRRIVIVGGGIAGLTAADALRSAGFDGELTIVGDEPRAAYSRPALSKALLRSDADLNSHELPAPDHGAIERLGVAATGLDADRRILHLDDGTELGYDGLVIASGSRARRLGDGELVLRTLDDALLLRERIAARPDVVIIGAGPLGMEAASGALEAGCRVTVVTNEPPMVRLLGPHLAEVIVAAARAHGVTLIETTDARVVDSSSVQLADGTLITGQLVLTAAGDIPNTEWLAGTSICEGGPLTVDSRGRVLVGGVARPEIVAAGDVAAFPTPAGHRRSPIWNSAIAQAKVAAQALLHADAAPELDDRPYFWTELFGLGIRIAGPTPILGEPELVDARDGGSLLRWRHEDGTATAVSINYRIPIPKLRRLCEAVPAAAG